MPLDFAVTKGELKISKKRNRYVSGVVEIGSNPRHMMHVHM